jgi:hypothetical protein
MSTPNVSCGKQRAGDSEASLVFVPRHLVALTVTHWTTVGKFLQALADSIPRHPSGINLTYSHIRHLPGEFLLKESRPPHGASFWVSPPRRTLRGKRNSCVRNSRSRWPCTFDLQ